MTRARSLALALVALSGVATGVRAQTAAQCEAAVKAHAPGVRISSDPCRDVAVMVLASAPAVVRAAALILQEDAVPTGSIFSQRDLQARYPQQPSLAGTAAQGQAIPSVQPAGVAAGTIAAVGTDAANDAIAALGLNPAILFIGDEVSRELAKYSRFADLTVFLPMSKLETQQNPRPPGGKKLEYFGVRLRLNVTGLANGDAVWNGADRLLRNWMTRAGRNLERVRQAMAAAPDLAACVDALLTTEEVAAITAGCGAPVTLEVDLREAEQLRRQFSRVRNAADARYFGADIRIDVGDPTLGTVANSSGQFTFAGLAFGMRLGDASGNQGTTYGVRSRLGVRHAKLDTVPKSEFAAEGGFGLEIARSIDEQEINLSAAVEFRQGNAPANLTDRFQTNFIMLRGSFLLPVTAGNSVSINVGIPVRGDVSRILSVNFNWGLLLPDAVRK
jgi:hypothetical protein